MENMTSDFLSPEQVKAARALLAWSQADLARAAQIGISTVADFERKHRSPIANNSSAIRSALEANGLTFIAGGVVAAAEIVVTTPPPGPGRLLRWISATDLSQWGQRRDAQSSLPELLTKLVYAVLGPRASVRFPSGDSVSEPGWDGVCNTDTSTSYVPVGISGWEMGTQREGIAGKARDDYQKRKDDPLGLPPREATFIFVTPHRWPGKRRWKEQCQKERFWKDVVVYDADDLVHWLEQYPAVASDFAAQIGTRPAGLRSLEELWGEWSKATAPALTSDIIATNRDEAAKTVLQWLRRPAKVLAVQAESPKEAAAFLYAAIAPLPDAHRISILGRTVVVSNDETARELIGIGHKLTIVVQDPEPGLAQVLAEDGHHVFSAYGAEAGSPTDILRLPRPWTSDLRANLEDMGIRADEAHRYASASGRSLAVLRRLMPAPVGTRPDWSVKTSQALLTAMLAGAWHGDREADRAVLERIGGVSYAELERDLTELSARLDGPIRRLGELWKLTSLRDAWTLMARYLTPSHINRALAAFSEVMGRIDPAFEGGRSNIRQLMLDKGQEPSEVLRRGLTEALTAMVVYPAAAPAIPTVADQARYAVRNLLASKDSRLWWSLSNDFRYLAEAAPEAFLDCLDAAIRSSENPVLSLFRRDKGLIHDDEYLANLLWGLETLAWNARLLGQVTLILGRLAELDPGGRSSNRPSNSLRQIFLPWSPQTHASASDRLRVLDRLAQRLPEIGWTTLLSLAPRGHDTSFPSPGPRWWDFAEKQPPNLTWKEIFAFNDEVGKRLLSLVGEVPNRWSSLLPHWAEFSVLWRQKACTKLQRASSSWKINDDVLQFREELRQYINNHRSFSDADWALSSSDVDLLEKVFNGIEPDDLLSRNAWLFQSSASQLMRGEDWHKQEAELRARQADAASAIIDSVDCNDILKFLDKISYTTAFGYAVAASKNHSEQQQAIYEQAINREGAHAADFSAGFLRRQLETRGRVEIEGLLAAAAIDADREISAVRLALSLPCDGVTWALLESFSYGIQHAYWSSIPLWSISDCVDLNYVVDCLLQHDRNNTALELLGHQTRQKSLGSDIIIKVLHAAVSKQNETDHSGMRSYYVANLFARLDQDKDLSEDTLMMLEWIYFVVLQHTERPARLVMKRLAQDPFFFVELIKALYSPAKDSGIVEKQEREPEDAHRLAKQAFRVLHDWARVPGSDNDDIIDASSLRAWIEDARRLCAQCGRGRIGDQKIGEVLAASRVDEGDAWPPEPIRDIIDDFCSEDIDIGLIIGVSNRRGVTVRDPRAGGELERNLVQRYKMWASQVALEWPRTASVLNRIADDFARSAKREDLQVESDSW